MSLELAILGALALGDKLLPDMTTSINYKHWESTNDWRRCKRCKDMHGKIWQIEEKADPEPPLHPNCRCMIVLMDAIRAGTATINGIDGADWTLQNVGELPDYYVEFEYAESIGWKRGKWPSNVVPGKMITGGIYRNDDGHLPDAKGRIWYEADINYKIGKRNDQRVVWSNDGLIFVTYDHYKTFYEIV